MTTHPAPGRFEALQHRINGEMFTVPLLFDEDRNPSHPCTPLLLRAAEILAPRLETGSPLPEDDDDSPLELEALIGKVGVILATKEDRDVDGLIIESGGGGSIIVKSATETTVALYGRRPASLPTGLFHDMLRAWDGFRQAEG